MFARTSRTMFANVRVRLKMFAYGTCREKYREAANEWAQGRTGLLSAAASLKGCPHLHPGRKAIRHSFLGMFYYGRLGAQNSGGTAYRAAG